MSKLGEMPKVVCLCGSTRFKAEFEEAAAVETLAGNIVLMPNVFLKEEEKDEAERDGCKERLDELHKRKIDMSDEILVINVDQYIGDSTRSEIDYAIRQRKVIRSLEAMKEVSG